MAPPNNASCISDLGASFLTKMGSLKKRKPDPEIQNNNKGVKRIRKKKKDTQKEIQKEIEDLAALEKENKELEDEETALKKRLQEMRNDYMNFIKNGQIVFVDNPTSTSQITSASPKLGESTPVPHFSQVTAQYQTRGTEYATHESVSPQLATTPPSTPQDCMLECSNPSISEHSVGCSEDSSSSAVQCIQLPVIQCAPIAMQWVAPPTPENDVFMSPQPPPSVSVENVSNGPFSATSCQTLVSTESFYVTVENIDLDSINSVVILPLDDTLQN